MVWLMGDRGVDGEHERMNVDEGEQVQDKMIDQQLVSNQRNFIELKGEREHL